MAESPWIKYVKSSSFKRQVAKYKCTESSNFNEQPENEHPAVAEDVPDALQLPLPEGSNCSREGSSEAITGTPVLVDGESMENTDYSPDDCSTNVIESLETFLQRWSIEHRISHAALKPLLLRLSIIDKTISTDPRRLLGTPRHEPTLIHMTSGEYWHNGLGNYSNCVFLSFLLILIKQKLQNTVSG